MIPLAVSVAIREPEVFYNTTLFDRMNHKIYITDTTAQFLSAVESITDTLAEPD